MAPELYEEFGHCMAGLMKLGVTKEVPWEVPADKVESETLQIVKGVPSTLAPCRESEAPWLYAHEGTGTRHGRLVLIRV
jgi:hypothetical protein